MKQIEDLSADELEQLIIDKKQEIIDMETVYYEKHADSMVQRRKDFIKLMDNRVGKCFKEEFGKTVDNKVYRTVYTKLLSYSESTIKESDHYTTNDTYGLYCKCLVLQLEILPRHVSGLHKAYVAYNTMVDSITINKECSSEEFENALRSEIDFMLK